jgi:fatty-acyl-CoA synthase
MDSNAHFAADSGAYAMPLLIKQLLLTPRQRAVGQQIVYQDRVRHDYGTFQQRIARLAQALTALGVRPGDTVAVMDWDSHRYLECYFAVPMLGAVLMTVNVRLSPEQIAYTIQHAEATVALVHADFLPLFAALRTQLPGLRACVLLQDEPTADLAGVHFAGEYEALLAAAAPTFAFADFDENTRATTFYTTGTTGLPKGVWFTHRQLVLHTLALAAGLGASQHGAFRRGDVYMPITPMFHVHAWGMPYVATLLGVKQVYPGRYLPETLLDLIAREGVTVSHCVPTILHMLLQHPKAATVDFSRWRVVIGGSALPEPLARAALARGIDVFAGYGMSETAPVLVLAHVPADLDPNDADAAVAYRCKGGAPIPLVDLRIVDAAGNTLPHDGVAAGEVLARAPWCTPGYLKNPEASAQLWAGGYLHTQDIGTIDARGYVKIVDRIKDVIKTGGEWVSSLDLENLIAQHAAVGEVAVVGVPDTRWGERPLAVVVLKPGVAPADAAHAIRAHVAAYAERGVVSKFAVPERIEFVDALARTSVGKIDKKALRAQFA